MDKGQGALEYLLIIGGAILIAAVVVTLIASTGQLGSKTAANAIDTFNKAMENALSGVGGGGGTPDLCPNGTIDTGEDCDGILLGGETCETQGFQGGNLACNSSCHFDKSNCYCVINNSCDAISFNETVENCPEDCCSNITPCVGSTDGKCQEACSGFYGCGTIPIEAIDLTPGTNFCIGSQRATACDGTPINCPLGCDSGSCNTNYDAAPESPGCANYCDTHNCYGYCSWSSVSWITQAVDETYSITLNWGTPNHDESWEDLDAGQSVAGYKVYYDNDAQSNGFGDYRYSKVVMGENSTELTNLASGTWYFYITSIDDQGNETQLFRNEYKWLITVGAVCDDGICSPAENCAADDDACDSQIPACYTAAACTNGCVGTTKIPNDQEDNTLPNLCNAAGGCGKTPCRCCNGTCTPSIYTC